VLEQRRKDLKSVQMAAVKVDVLKKQDVKIQVVSSDQILEGFAPIGEETALSSDSSNHSREQKDEHLKHSEAKED
jgi:hypothetical protein